MTKLLIVESPHKARKIQKLLLSLYPEDKWRIEPTYGHIVDLPKKELGIKVDDNSFSVSLVINNYKAYNKILAAAKGADEILIATDPDREGEAIARYVSMLLEDRLPNTPIHRARIYEITQRGVKEAVDNADIIDQGLCEAQLARRIIDRLVGFVISPALWDLMNSGLSAGRVQSYALSLLVEKERLRRKHVPSKVSAFSIKLTSGTTLMSSYLHTKTTQRAMRAARDTKKSSKAELVFEEVDAVLAPRPPFITSTILQEAGWYLAMSPEECMSNLQILFESGYITYHRTDSYRLSPSFATSVVNFIDKIAGKKYVADKMRLYKGFAAKGAQEAHEAIHPTDITCAPSQLENVSSKLRELYKLIWQRSIATQAADATIKKQLLGLKARGKHLNKYLVAGGIIARAEGIKVVFDGWTRFTNGNFTPFNFGVEVKPVDGDTHDPSTIQRFSKLTEPPERFTESSLIAELERKEVGRPSTYVSTIVALRRHKYISVGSGGRILVLRRGELVHWVLENHDDIREKLFSDKFTASMEHTLDRIATGKDSVANAKTVSMEIWSWLKPAVERLKEFDTESKFLVPGVGKSYSVVVPRKGEPYLLSNTKRNREVVGMDFSIEDDKPTMFKPSKISGTCVSCGKEELQLEQSKHGPFARCTACLAINHKARI